jgi:hypothetical protein
VEGSGYKLYPWVHVSRLKPRALFPDRPTTEVEVAEEDDFDAALLPEDVSEPDESQSIYEVEIDPGCPLGQTNPNVQKSPRISDQMERVPRVGMAPSFTT